MGKTTSFLGLFLVFLLSSFGCGRNVDTPIQIDGEVGVSAAVSLTEGHFKSLAQSLELMAMTDEVKSGNWDKMRPMIAKFQQDQIPTIAWFALPDGSYSTVDLGKTDKNIADRAYFAKVMSGEKSLGEMVVSKTTGEKVVVVAVPVKNGGKVIGAVGASSYLEKMSEIIVNELRLSEDVVFYAFNDQGTITLHTDPARIMSDAAEQGSESLSSAVKQMMSSKEGTVSYRRGEESERVTFKTSALTGWCFALGQKAK